MKQLLILFFCITAAQLNAQDTTKAKLKQYLGVLTLTEKFRDEKNWTKTEEGIVGQHFQRLLKFKNEAIVVLAGRTNYETSNPDMMGLVIFYAKDDASAKQFMMDDPAVKNNIMLAKVHPYGIAINKCD